MEMANCALMAVRREGRRDHRAARCPPRQAQRCPPRQLPGRRLLCAPFFSPVTSARRVPPVMRTLSGADPQPRAGARCPEQTGL